MNINCTPIKRPPDSSYHLKYATDRLERVMATVADLIKQRGNTVADVFGDAWFLVEHNGQLEMANSQDLIHHKENGHAESSLSYILASDLEDDDEDMHLMSNLFEDWLIDPDYKDDLYEIAIKGYKETIKGNN